MAGDEWSPTDPAWEQAAELELADIGLLDELTHPVRGAIVRRLREPRTVAELAALLDVPVTRLYHHVNLLEAAGLIRVDATRRVGAVTERRYRTVARSYRISPELIERSDPELVARAISGLFDVAKSALLRELELGAMRDSTVDDRVVQSWVQLHLSPARQRALAARHVERGEEYADHESGDAYRLFLAAFPETP